MESEFLSEVKNEPSLSTIAIREEELNVMTLLMTKSIHSESLRLKREVRRRGMSHPVTDLGTVSHNDTRELVEIRVRELVERSDVRFHCRIDIQSLESWLDDQCFLRARRV